MSSYINTNTTANEAAYNLGINQSNIQKNIERLSSGLRINSAADDAAGLVISESLRAQSAGLTQATANTNNAINVVKTAEGALSEVHSLLINIRSLVVHAANVGANDPTALKADQDSIASAVASRCSAPRSAADRAVAVSRSATTQVSVKAITRSALSSPASLVNHFANSSCTMVGTSHSARSGSSVASCTPSAEPVRNSIQAEVSTSRTTLGRCDRGSPSVLRRAPDRLDP